MVTISVKNKKKKDTTTMLQSKNWEHMSVRLPKETKDKLREDAKKHMRPIGMHLAYVVTKYYKGDI